MVCVILRPQRQIYTDPSVPSSDRTVLVREVSSSENSYHPGPLKGEGGHIIADAGFIVRSHDSGRDVEPPVDLFSAILRNLMIRGHTIPCSGRATPAHHVMTQSTMSLFPLGRIDHLQITYISYIDRG